MRNEAINKSFKNYDYLSRYASVPYYYSVMDDKYFLGEKSNLDDTTSYIIHKVTRGETLDSISLDYYNTPVRWWIIADFNHMHDCFEDLKEGMDLKIPSIGELVFK